MLLSAEHISINFGSRQLLEDVDFYLNEGDKVGVIGINGTGKSTFLKVLAGVTEPDAGRISRNPNVQVSILAQNPAMDDNATVLKDGEAGLANWMKQFFASELAAMPENARTLVLKQVEDQTRAALWNGNEWVADYRRLRAVAHLA